MPIHECNVTGNVLEKQQSGEHSCEQDMQLVKVRKIVWMLRLMDPSARIACTRRVKSGPAFFDMMDKMLGWIFQSDAAERNFAYVLEANFFPKICTQMAENQSDSDRCGYKAE